MRHHLALLATLSLALPGFAAGQTSGGASKPADAKPTDSKAADASATPSQAGAASPQGGAGSGPSTPAQPAVNPATVLAEVVGTVKRIDGTAHRLEVDSGGETVAVTYDRNTMVYTPRGLGTVRDVTPGAHIRLGRNAKFLAYWVQVRPPGGSNEPVSTPDQGSSPTTGSGPPSEPNGGTPSVPAGPPAGGSVTPGTSAGGPGR